MGNSSIGPHNPISEDLFFNSNSNNEVDSFDLDMDLDEPESLSKPDPVITNELINPNPDIADTFGTDVAFYEIFQNKTGELEAHRRDAGTSAATTALNENRLIGVVERDGQAPQLLVCPSTDIDLSGNRTLHLFDQNGVLLRSHSTDEFEIREFTPREMTLLSNYFMAAFAAAEARKRLEEEQRRREEEKKLAQEQLDKALKHNHHTKNQPVAKPVKEPATTDATNSKKNDAQFSSSVLRDQQDSVKKQRAEAAMQKIEKFCEKMVEIVKADINKKDIEKNLINDDLKNQEFVKPNRATRRNNA